ncbi:MAG: hypothetical protein H7246_23570 [Phycisphaerae bacterium]|nr:hypothetical protein [Saprospiraceae bacterium]
MGKQNVAQILAITIACLFVNTLYAESSESLKSRISADLLAFSSDKKVTDQIMGEMFRTYNASFKISSFRTSEYVLYCMQHVKNEIDGKPVGYIRKYFIYDRRFSKKAIGFAFVLVVTTFAPRIDPFGEITAYFSGLSEQKGRNLMLAGISIPFQQFKYYEVLRHGMNTYKTKILYPEITEADELKLVIDGLTINIPQKSMLSDAR